MLRSCGMQGIESKTYMIKKTVIKTISKAAELWLRIFPLTTPALEQIPHAIVECFEDWHRKADVSKKSYNTLPALPVNSESFMSSSTDSTSVLADLLTIIAWY
jgi:hypothetical protein